MMTTSRIRKTAGSIAFATERLIHVLASGMIAGVGLVAVLGFGPAVEARLWPVIGTQSVTEITRDADMVSFSMQVDKLRECRLAGGDWSIEAGRRHSPVKVTNAIGAPAIGSVTYPVGLLDIGPFTATLPFDVNGPASLYAILYYDCHFGWLTKATLGPVPIPEPT